MVEQRTARPIGHLSAVSLAALWAGGVFLLRMAFVALFAVLTPVALAEVETAGSTTGFVPETNDVFAFLGGADTTAAQETGHLEALLAVAFRNQAPRFRNLGWEGSTVFDRQARDVGFPGPATQLQRIDASVIFVQYGRGEALDTNHSAAEFKAAYEGVIAECLRQSRRVVLVTPPPFEKGPGLLPDLTKCNPELAARVDAIRELARARHFVLVDSFGELGSGGARGDPLLTENGLQLTPRGHALVARAFARQLGCGPVADEAGDADEQGRWSNRAFERVRQAVIAKNRLWFNYWRPQNWAFLGGDRTSQPSSRDHRDPNVRWFPEEMKQFLPLIRQGEGRIQEAVWSVRP